MRRTVWLSIGLCAAILALTGVAGAAELRERPTVGDPVASGPLRADVPAAKGSGTQTVGAIEQIAAGAPDQLTAGRRMEFHYPNADYVKVHFSRFELAPGDRVTVSDRSGGERTTYRSAAEVREAGQWAMSVSGDAAVVELERADPRAGLPGPGRSVITVDRVARGFTRIERKSRATAERAAGRERSAQRRAGSDREESICGRSDEKADAVCYRSDDPVAYERSKAVARLLINGTELCTGWRVGPNNRMFTNNHCFAGTPDARRTEVWFNYECAVCGGWDVLRTTKVWGGRVIASDERLDYTLFSVQNFAAVQRFGFLELDARQPLRGEELYIPQHPRGDPTVITTADPGESSGNCAIDNPAYDGYGVDTDVSYYCDTDGGSSGSPVIARSSGRVIALHHFGGCPNSGVRVDRIAAQIGALL